MPAMRMEAQHLDGEGKKQAPPGRAALCAAALRRHAMRRGRRSVLQRSRRGAPQRLEEADAGTSHVSSSFSSRGGDVAIRECRRREKVSQRVLHSADVVARRPGFRACRTPSSARFFRSSPASKRACFTRLFSKCPHATPGA